MSDALINTRTINLTAGTRTRFEKHFIPEPNTGCWLWQGSIRIGGYGQFNTGSTRDGTAYPAQAHRVAYELYRGPIQPGMVLDHTCRNRLCVNPDHLEVMTLGDNTRRGLQGKLKKTCGRGHPWIEENISRPKGYWARCRICALEGVRRWYARRRANLIAPGEKDG